MNINFSFGATVPLAARTALTNAANIIDSAFSNKTSVNITIGWGDIAGTVLPSGALGASSSSVLSYSTSAVLAALHAEVSANSDPVKTNAVASLSDVTSPTVLLTTAEAKALTLYSSTGTDGYVGFDSTAVWSFSQAATFAANAYDFTATALHEITEVLGRISNYDGAPGIPTLLDLYRFTAPGARAVASAVTAGATNYFSTDHGSTNSGKFNTNPAGDLGDWASQAGGAVAAHDQAAAFGSPGVKADFSSADYQLLDAIGWNLTTATSPTAVVTTANVSHAFNDLSYSPSASGSNHFIDLLNFEASFSDLIVAFGNDQKAMQSWYNTYEPVEHRVASFNGLDYIASYPDLIAAFKTGTLSQVEDNGAAHYINSGINENRTTSFNGLDYIASYADLIKAFGANSDAGAFHFIENGVNENRTTHFDGLSYIAQYTDLMKAFGSSEQAGAAHYIQNGFNEHRSAAFDVAGYYAAHPDLVGHYANADAFLTAYIDQYAHYGTFLV